MKIFISCCRKQNEIINVRFDAKKYMYTENNNNNKSLTENNNNNKSIYSLLLHTCTDHFKENLQFLSGVYIYMYIDLHVHV